MNTVTISGKAKVEWEDGDTQHCVMSLSDGVSVEFGLDYPDWADYENPWGGKYVEVEIEIPVSIKVTT